MLNDGLNPVKMLLIGTSLTLAARMILWHLRKSVELLSSTERLTLGVLTVLAIIYSTYYLTMLTG